MRRRDAGSRWGAPAPRAWQQASFASARAGEPARCPDRPGSPAPAAARQRSLRTASAAAPTLAPSPHGGPHRPASARDTLAKPTVRRWQCDAGRASERESVRPDHTAWLGSEVRVEGRSPARQPRRGPAVALTRRAPRPSAAAAPLRPRRFPVGACPRPPGRSSAAPRVAPARRPGWPRVPPGPGVR